MLKKTITFEDLDGNPITEDFYFNLSKAEIAEMELGQKGGLTTYLQKIIAEEDNSKIMEMFKELLVKSVGKRSEDGRRFIKNQEIVDDFIQTDAYSELFIELATNAEQAVAFITGIVPSSMQEAVATASKATTDLSLPPAASDSAEASSPAPAEPAWLTEGRTPTPDEVKAATPEQLRLAFQRKQADQAAETPPTA